jgi:cation diffusion facilitator family transporter
MKIMLHLALRGAALTVSVADCTVAPESVRPESRAATRRSGRSRKIARTLPGSLAVKHLDVIGAHPHVFLGTGHERNERKTWAVIALCGAMMVVEIVGGALFGSLALIADGLHMSTHAGAMLIAALAYTYARRHVEDPRFVFGTGKLGDLAGFTSAVVLAMIALLIGYEAVARLLSPVSIRFTEAIPIAVLGLLVNVVSAWLLSGDEPHAHGQERRHAAAPGQHHDHDHDHGHGHAHEPQAGHVAASPAHRDHNMRSAYVHVLGDAVVSVLAIIGLTLARLFGWVWMDPLAGIVGALVIGNWSYRLIRDTGSVLLDVNPDEHLTARIREVIEGDGDRLTDLHLWRLGPGHLGAVVSVMTAEERDCNFYRARLKQFAALSHITVEVMTPGGSSAV